MGESDRVMSFDCVAVLVTSLEDVTVIELGVMDGVFVPAPTAFACKMRKTLLLLAPSSF